MRQIIEKHRAVASCASATTGSTRSASRSKGSTPSAAAATKDLAGRPVDTQAELKDGTEFDGIDGLRDYLLTKRRDEFVGHFCRKLLGYCARRDRCSSPTSPCSTRCAERIGRRRLPGPGRDPDGRPQPPVPLRRGQDSPLERDEAATLN